MGKKRCPVCDMTIIPKKKNICNSCEGRIGDFKSKKYKGEIMIQQKNKDGEVVDIKAIPF